MFFVLFKLSTKLLSRATFSTAVTCSSRCSDFSLCLRSIFLNIRRLVCSVVMMHQWISCHDCGRDWCTRVEFHKNFTKTPSAISCSFSSRQNRTAFALRHPFPIPADRRHAFKALFTLADHGRLVGRIETCYRIINARYRQIKGYRSFRSTSNH